MFIAVFDIGGTSIKYGVLNEEGTILMDKAFPAEAHLGGEVLIQNVIAKSKELQQEWALAGIAISSAGQIDNKTGVVVHATDNIPGYTGVRIKQRVEEATGLSVTVENDVNCTALGEYWKGAATDAENFLCITIGTGIGGAIFTDGRLYVGARFSAGEIGHINLYPDGKPCTCGDHGCLEQYASSSALQEMIKETFGYTINLREFFDRLRTGDPKGMAVYNKWIDNLTTGLKSIVHTLNPELIVIGGGISAQGDFLLDPIKESLSEKIMPNYQVNLDVRIAQHANQANLLGAAKHFIDQKGG
ncbi:ROK family protein [Lentibacillus cibarius]|uniref:ROK family protein n=1 Tax=Lentibacillus cibarius TaxID=2583219 RepID=A0A549YFJ1_9BACI|nr:ROK family protein [Lentibacillus cibarius]TMN21759.1 ROK family protein [Lentibacillus cibarius]TRM10618.1 ROK family protein [Lentibacillus cibarius]